MMAKVFDLKTAIIRLVKSEGARFEIGGKADLIYFHIMIVHSGCDLTLPE